MGKCKKIIINTNSDKYESILRILRIVGIDDAYADNLEEECTIEFFIRNKDEEYYINSIKSLISQYQNKFDDNFEYKLRIVDDCSDTGVAWYYNNLNFMSSYKSVAVYFEPAIIFEARPDGPDFKDEEIIDYLDRTRSRPNRYIIPVRNNEFILNNSSYMHNFKLNLMILDSLKLSPNEDVLIIGEHRFLYGNIISDVYNCNVTLKESIDVNSEDGSYDRILIFPDSILSNVRSILLWSILHVSKTVIIGNIVATKSSYYTKQFSDIKYSEFMAGHYTSYVFGNIDDSIYTNEIRNGY